ncbi:MAG: hypothetical protein ACPIOQ_53020, partial [Promethearchaeia archaeon]
MRPQSTRFHQLDHLVPSLPIRIRAGRSGWSRGTGSAAAAPGASVRLPRLRGGSSGAGAEPPAPGGSPSAPDAAVGGSGASSAAGIAAARTLKDQGNEVYAQGELQKAMELYAQAYQMVSQVDASSDALLEERSRLQMACLINKAQAASTLGLYQEAFSCCSLALEIDPRNVRAYHRRAVALQGMHEFQAARQDLEAVLYLDPAHKDAAQMLQALPVAAVDETGMEDDTTSVSRSNSVGSERGARTAARGKKDPGIAGLKNEGATCYLNAVVQALHHLPDLRAAIYSVPTQAPARGEAPSVALAMQHLFWRLQSVRKSQSTRELLARCLVCWAHVPSSSQRGLPPQHSSLCPTACVCRCPRLHLRLSRGCGGA